MTTNTEPPAAAAAAENPAPPRSRRAGLGELCTCGRQATQVFESRPGDPVGWCGLNNAGRPVDDRCVFCGDELRHDGAGWDEAAQTGFPIPQGDKCPRYRLRPEETAGPAQVSA